MTMMLSELTSVILGLVFFSKAAEANIGESLQVKFYDRDFNVSASKIRDMLKKADLKGHGYKVEVITKTVKEPGKPEYVQKSYFFYKTVNCSRIMEIEKELNKLMPGLFGSGVANQLRTEEKIRHMDNMGRCKAGLEVEFARIATNQGSKRLPRGVSVKGSVSIEVKKNSKGSWSFKVKAEVKVRITKGRKGKKRGWRG